MWLVRLLWLFGRRCFAGFEGLCAQGVSAGVVCVCEWTRCAVDESLGVGRPLMSVPMGALGVFTRSAWLRWVPWARVHSLSVAEMGAVGTCSRKGRWFRW